MTRMILVSLPTLAGHAGLKPHFSKWYDRHLGKRCQWRASKMKSHKPLVGIGSHTGYGSRLNKTAMLIGGYIPLVKFCNIFLGKRRVSATGHCRRVVISLAKFPLLDVFYALGKRRPSRMMMSSVDMILAKCFTVSDGLLAWQAAPSFAFVHGRRSLSTCQFYTWFHTAGKRRRPRSDIRGAVIITLAKRCLFRYFSLFGKRRPCCITIIGAVTLWGATHA